MFVVMGCVTFGLIKEYWFFKEQSSRVLELKEEYREYVLALKNVVHEYRRFKELPNSSALVDAQTDDAKTENPFPEGTRVFSSDDTGDQESFCVLNRDPSHLRQSSIAHLKEHDLGILCHAATQSLVDYNDELTQRVQPRKNKKKKRRARRNARPVTQKTYRDYKLLNDQLSSIEGQRDMTFIWPVERTQFWLSSRFGPRKHGRSWGFHQGIDMAAIRGTLVRAGQDGVVSQATVNPGYGKVIVLSHNHKYKTRYAHLHKILVKEGQHVKQGQVIGKVGDTGCVRSSGRDASHLHFEVMVYGKRMNPLYFIA